MREPDRQNGPADASGRRSDRSKVSLYSVFRAAHKAKDARVPRNSNDDGSSAISRHARARWHGESEHVIREQIRDDIATLFGTVHIEAVHDLSDLPHMRKSVVNYGFIDLTAAKTGTPNNSALAQAVRRTLIAHEPRIIPQTLDVQMQQSAKDEDHKIAVTFAGEMQADPVDVAVEFEASVDLGAGRLDLTDKTGGA